MFSIQVEKLSNIIFCLENLKTKYHFTFQIGMISAVFQFIYLVLVGFICQWPIHSLWSISNSKGNSRYISNLSCFCRTLSLVFFAQSLCLTQRISLCSTLIRSEILTKALKISPLIWLNLKQPLLLRGAFCTFQQVLK